MPLFKNPFNYVVRSHEALILGLMIGFIIGTVGVLFIPTNLDSKEYSIPSNICGSYDKVDMVSFSSIGAVNYVKCKDGTFHGDF